MAPEGSLIFSYLEKANFMFKSFTECELTLFNARETSITADFGKKYFLAHLITIKMPEGLQVSSIKLD